MEKTFVKHWEFHNFNLFRPSSAVISAPAQTITSKSSNADDDDIEAMLKKYETEVKKEIKKSSLMPTQVAQHQRKTQNVETVKKAAASVSTNKTPVAAPPQGIPFSFIFLFIKVVWNEKRSFKKILVFYAKMLLLKAFSSKGPFK